MLHDFYIDKIELDFQNKRAILFCTFEDKETKKTVIFEDFLAAKLQDIVIGNIILDVEELDVESYFEVDEKYLFSGLKWGWPMAAENMDDLKSKLVSNSYKVWTIFATCGMNGYLIAKSSRILQFGTHLTMQSR